MNRSQTIGNLAKALSAAQGKMKGAAKDSSNPFFKSKYADLASVWDACREALADAGLAIVQTPSAEGAKVTVVTMLVHESGEWLEEPLTVTAKEDSPQAIGSAITYARRYGLASVVGVAPEDDDGEAAHSRPTQTTHQPSRPAPAPAPKPTPEAAVLDSLQKHRLVVVKRIKEVTQDLPGFVAEAVGKKQPHEWTADDISILEAKIAKAEGKDLAY